MPRCGIAVPHPGFGTHWKHLTNDVSAIHYFSVGVWSSLQMRPMDLSLCRSPWPTSTFCTCWRMFSPSPSRAGSSLRLNRRKTINPLSLANRWLLCCGLGWSLRSPELMFIVWTGFKMERGWVSEWLLFPLHCLLFQQRKRNLPQTSYVELVLVVDNLRVSVHISLWIRWYVSENELAASRCALLRHLSAHRPCNSLLRMCFFYAVEYRAISHNC